MARIYCAVRPETVPVLLLALACLACHTKPQQSAPLPFEQALAKQRSLSPPEVAALQDLRLLAAVQNAQFSKSGSFLSPDQLKSAGLLDPAWPRSSPANYRIEFTVAPAGASFEAYADPVDHKLSFFRIDESQVVRTNRQRRPTADSAAF